MCKDNPVREIVSLFGGLKKMASAMGHKNHSTIYSWVRSGKIPNWRNSEIQEAARKNSIHIPDNLRKSAFEGELA